MRNEAWYCDICDNGKNYTLAGRRFHMKTKKHNQNADALLYQLREETE